MSEFRTGGGHARPDYSPPPEVDVREALTHAVAAELARIPKNTRNLLGLADTDAVVTSVLSGGEEAQVLAKILKAADPDFDVADAEKVGLDRESVLLLQDKMLQGYTSEGWTPEQIKALGRDPEPLEYSPGAKMLADIRARQELMGKVSPNYRPKKTGSTFEWLADSLLGDEVMNHPISKEEAARQYLSSVSNTHAPFSLKSLQSPETAIGNYVTKMGPVISDTLSQLGTAMLSDGESAMDSMGNAAVRSYGADWNRVSPVLKNHTDWRSSHKLIGDMRKAYGDSEGMDSADTLRAATGIRPSSWTRPVEWAMSLINSSTDGSVGATGFGKAAASAGAKGVARETGWKALRSELMEEALTDGGFNAAVELSTPKEYRQQKEQESDTAFSQRQQDESARRQQAIKQLEANNDQVKRPDTWFQKYAAKPFGNVIGGLLD